jgi:hypothetical protein
MELWLRPPLRARHWIGSPAIAAPIAIAFALVASSCDQPTSSTTLPTPSAASSPISAASPLASPSPPPGGGPLPAQLLGDWFLPPMAVNAVFGTGVCPSPATAANCFLRINLAATTASTPLNFHWYATDTAGKDQLRGWGNVVVNNNEIDFFNGPCSGVGRYRWTVKGGLLHFTLISDPCGRSTELAYKGYGPYPDADWSRTA